ncbi:hypothetical protein C0995_001301, partial [Termitomyces sp. Mi166
MAGMGNPIHQVDNAGVSPAPQAGEMPEASVYKPLPKRDDLDPCNVSASFEMPGGLSVSWMKSILNPGAWPEERTFASGALPSLVYPELPKRIGAVKEFGQSSPSWKNGTGQRATLDSTSVNGGGRRGPVIDAYDVIPTINPDWMGRDDNAASEVEQVPSAPPAGSNQEESGQRPSMRHKSLPEVLVEEPDQESSNEEEDGWSMSTLSVQLQLVLDRFPTVTKELMQKRLQLYV